MSVFIHSGKAGDFIASLATVKYLSEKNGDKATIILDTTGGLTSGDKHTNEIVMKQTGGKGLKFPKSVCEYLKPLVEAQPYVEKVVIYDGYSELPKIDYNLNMFRACFLVPELAKKSGTNLELAHKVVFDIPTNEFPTWLEIPKYSVKYLNGRNIGIARTPRYTSAHLWIAVHEPQFGEHGFFLGTQFEHQIFKETFDFTPQHIPTSSALEAAELIMGSDQFIANGTLMYWIAVGLGHPNIIHELAVDVPTTFYSKGERDNIRYVVGGKMVG